MRCPQIETRPQSLSEAQTMRSVSQSVDQPMIGSLADSLLNYQPVRTNQRLTPLHRYETLTETRKSSCWLIYINASKLFLSLCYLSRNL
jgi:hypothetical protein